MKGFLFYPTVRLQQAIVGKVKTVVAKQKSNLLDDLASRLRGLLDGLDRLISPQQTPKPVRVPIPVPVQPQQHPQRYRDPYRN